MSGWHHEKAAWALKECKVCGTKFTPKSGSHKYCSTKCKRQFSRTYGCESTERQYALVSNNWEKYFGRLCLRAFRRDTLTKQDCVELLKKQNYKCALTGLPLTCVLQKGQVTKTNASIDRIDPKKEYSKENVQLVCAVINKFRIDTPVEEFIDWCRKVVNHALQK